MKVVVPHLLAVAVQVVLFVLGWTFAESVYLGLASWMMPGVTLVVTSPADMAMDLYRLRMGLAVALALPVTVGQLSALVDGLIRWAPTPPALWGPMVLGPAMAGLLGLCAKVGWVALAMGDLDEESITPMVSLGTFDISGWAIGITGMLGAIQVVMVGLLALRLKKRMAALKAASTSD